MEPHIAAFVFPPFPDTSLLVLPRLQAFKLVTMTLGQDQKVKERISFSSQTLSTNYAWIEIFIIGIHTTFKGP